jgi:hypothetical protein
MTRLEIVARLAAAFFMDPNANCTMGLSAEVITNFFDVAEQLMREEKRRSVADLIKAEARRVPRPV